MAFGLMTSTGFTMPVGLVVSVGLMILVELITSVVLCGVGYRPREKSLEP